MEDLILLTREEAWDILRLLERNVVLAERAGREDHEALTAFRLLTAKLFPDLFGDR